MTKLAHHERAAARVVVPLERLAALGEVLSGRAVLAVHLVEARRLLVQLCRLVRPLQVAREERGRFQVPGGGNARGAAGLRGDALRRAARRLLSSWAASAASRGVYARPELAGKPVGSIAVVTEGRRPSHPAECLALMYILLSRCVCASEALTEASIARCMSLATWEGGGVSV